MARRRLAVGFVCLVTLGLAMLAVFAIGDPGEPGEDAASRTAVQAAIERLCEVAPGALAVDKMALGDGAYQVDARYVNAAGEPERLTARVLVGPPVEITRVFWYSRGQEAKRDVGLEGAKAAALSMLNRASLDVGAWRLSRAVKTGIGPYLLCWDRTVSDMGTGTYVTLIVAAGGAGVISYDYVKAAREVPPSALQITCQRAQEIGVALASRGMPDGFKCEAEQATAMLSWRHAPESGPVWFVKVRFVDEHTGNVTGVGMKIVDAITGQELGAPVGGEP